MRTIQELILESELLRLETHSDGPQDELEFWKSRAAKLTLLVEQISSTPCKMTLATLKVAQSRLIKVSIPIVNYFTTIASLTRFGENVSIRLSSTMLRLLKMPSFLEQLKNPVIQSI